VHINDADSVNIYSDYVRYTGNDKKAYLKGNVSLSDGKATLTSPDLNYDLNTKIGIYTNGGKVISGTSVLISKEGYYFGETRDVHFNKNVLLIDTNYTVKTADSMYYNTNTQIATFVSPTEIASGKKSKVLTDSGYYDTKNKRSYFTKRSTIQDSTTFITADEIANDEISGFGEASGNVIYEDTAQHIKIYSDNLKSNRNSSSFLATIHPVMMIRQEQDSIFIAADTLFSAKLSDLRQSRNVADITNAGETKKNRYAHNRQH